MFPLKPTTNRKWNYQFWLRLIKVLLYWGRRPGLGPRNIELTGRVWITEKSLEFCWQGRMLSCSLSYHSFYFLEILEAKSDSLYVCLFASQFSWAFSSIFLDHFYFFFYELLVHIHGTFFYWYIPFSYYSVKVLCLLFF